MFAKHRGACCARPIFRIGATLSCFSPAAIGVTRSSACRKQVKSGTRYKQRGKTTRCDSMRHKQSQKCVLLATKLVCMCFCVIMFRNQASASSFRVLSRACACTIRIQHTERVKTMRMRWWSGVYVFVGQSYLSRVFVL